MLEVRRGAGGSLRERQCASDGGYQAARPGRLGLPRAAGHGRNGARPGGHRRGAGPVRMGRRCGTRGGYRGASFPAAPGPGRRARNGTSLPQFEAVARRLLLGEGLPERQVEAALQRVRAALQRTLADERGQWILSAAHQDRRSELPLTARDRWPGAPHGR